MIAHDLHGMPFELVFDDTHVTVDAPPFRILRIDIGLLKQLVDKHGEWYAKSVNENGHLIEAYSDPDVDPDEYKCMVLGDGK